MMKNNITRYYKDRESCALTLVHLNDDSQSEQLAKARYFKDDSCRSDKKHDHNVSQQVGHDKHLSITNLTYILFSFVSFLVPAVRYTQLPQTPSLSSSSKLQHGSKQRYAIESNSTSLKRLSEPKSTGPDLQWPSDGRSSDRSENNPARQDTGMLTRIFHYIVAPPIIREAQQKQQEDDGDNDQEFQIDYSKAAIQFGRRLLAEILGTILFILVFGSCAIEVGERRLGREAAAFACGFMGLFLAFSLGSISGAHLNPLVTLAFALRFVFRTIKSHTKSKTR